MIKSMTGFGIWEESNKERKILVEMKSVNHRYCDINIRLPKKLLIFESEIRTIIKNYIARGKVDVFITYEDYTNNHVSVKYNEQLAKGYMDAFQKMEEGFGISNDIRVSHLAGFREVLTLEETIDEKEIWPILERALIKASGLLLESRILEGSNLKKDLLLKLDEMNDHISFIEKKSPQIVEDYYNKIKTKVEELLGDTRVDESVLATEITIFADKVCVDEETVRLISHISNMRKTLETEEGIGRKLDFIAQEMNREANTILSKVNDLEVTNIGIDLKSGIEKIREQIQNIE